MMKEKRDGGEGNAKEERMDEMEEVRGYLQ